jgi:hypothetical protein
MSKKSILSYTTEIYRKNFRLILFAALPGLIGLLIPLLFIPTTYNALGGVYLRTGNITQMGLWDMGILIGAMMMSIYLMSFAIVSINIVIKSQRTMRSIGRRVVESLGTTTLSVFMMFLIASLFLVLIQLLTFELQMQQILAPILNAIVGLVMLFLPAAIVIDEVRPFRALQRSIRLLKKKWRLVFTWLIIALFVLSVFDWVMLSIIPHPHASWIVLILNSLIILPYLIVLLGQIYISKYTILVD